MQKRKFNVFCGTCQLTGDVLMNRNQRTLTIVGLIVFVLSGLAVLNSGNARDFRDLRLFWFMLAVVYVGLFFLFKTRKSNQVW